MIIKKSVHVIYDDWNTSVDDYQDLFDEIEQERAEEYADGCENEEELAELSALSDDEKYNIYCRELEAWFDAERANLNIQTKKNLIAIADLGLWNGRRTGYRILRNNINSIFDVCEDYNAWTCDRYNVRGRLVHHDGTHYVLYRVFKDDVTDEQIERLCDALYEGNADDRMIRRYTRSIAPEVKAVYGWK